MAPKQTTTGEHCWTAFEKHTLFCLMSRNIHITGMGGTLSPRGAQKKKRADARTSTLHAHMDVATELNRTLNYEDMTRDIDYREVSAMIDQLLATRKSAVKFMDRCNRGRVTRASRKVWERGLKFDGSLAEWLEGRNKEQAAQHAKKMIRTLTNQVRNQDLGQDQDMSGVAAAWGGVEVATQDLGPTTAGISAGWGGEETTAVDFGGAWKANDDSSLLGDNIGWGNDTVDKAGEALQPNDPWGEDESTLVDVLPANSHSLWEGTTLIEDKNGNQPLLLAGHLHADAGINPARLALLETADISDEPTMEEQPRGRTTTGDNAVALPFNRLDQKKPRA